MEAPEGFPGEVGHLNETCGISRAAEGTLGGKMSRCESLGLGTEQLCHGHVWFGQGALAEKRGRAGSRSENWRMDSHPLTSG